MSSVRGRLAAFLVVLLGVFGTAYAVGERAPGHSHGGAGHSHSHSHSASLVPPGFESGDYQLVTDSVKGADGQPRLLTFHLQHKDGRRVTEFQLNHEKLIHAILVRPDLSGFQHLHPDIADDGSWQITLEQPGAWHLVFDTMPGQETMNVVVSANSDDEVSVEPVPLPAADDDITIGGLRIIRSGLDFTVVNEDGTSTDLEPYLGAAGHLVAIREGDLAYVHLHAGADPTMADMLMFGSKLPQPGTYRLFVQFGHAGSVVTAEFTVVQQ